MGKKKGLLSDTTEQTYRIKDVGSNHREYSKEYPEILRGIMSVEDYIGYINRINEVAYVSMKILFLSYIPMFVGLPLCPLIIIVVGPPYGPIIGPVLFMVGFFLSMPGILIFNERKKKATRCIETIVDEINIRFDNYGLTWACHKGVTHLPRYITITLINVNRPGSLTPLYSPASISGDISSSLSSSSATPQYNMQTYPPTYEPPVYPSAPPPATSSSKSEFHAIITPNEEPPSPSYPGDPTMFTIVN